MTIWSTQNSGLLFTRCLYSFCMRFSKIRTKNLYTNKSSCNSATQKYTGIAYYIHSHYERRTSRLDSLADKILFKLLLSVSSSLKSYWLYTDKTIFKRYALLVQGIFCSQPTTLSLKLHSHVAFKAFLSLTEFSARLTISLHLQCAPAQRLLQVSSQMWSFNICFRLLRLALLTTCSQFQRYDW